MMIKNIEEYAIKEYQKRQENTWDGDPVGFKIWWNGRSRKLSHTSLYTQKESDNYITVARVYSNGSLEIEESL